MASVIAMAGDKVIMPRNTMMMIHDMGWDAWGNARQLRKLADDLDIINAAGRAAYLTKAGDKLSEETLVQLMEAETWLTAEQCLAYGLADELAEQDADMTAAAQLLKDANLDMEQRIRIQKSLAAQLKQLTDVSKLDTAPETKPNTIMQLLSRL